MLMIEVKVVPRVAHPPGILQSEEEYVWTKTGGASVPPEGVVLLL